ncbi:MAG: ABC transporter permease [Desulfotomaculaceae bacterium]|nr:ABC transporter permease [Desulfotomaculaceae bacterium]MDD4766215.1 ABC transporter permease [Desulfotomaculaceae bacterium]
MKKVSVSFVANKEKISHRLSRYIDLTAALALRDVKMRYQLTILGLYWAVLNPLLMTVVWSFVFSRIFRAQGIQGVPYVVFLFCGLTFWNLFSNSLMTAVNCLTGNASLLSKLYFPRVILPTASVMARLVDFIFSLVVLIILMLVYRVVPGKELYWIPLLILVQLIFTLGMAYIVASVNVLYRDLSQILGVLLTLWLYISPVIYTLEQVPAGIKKYFIFNPIGQLVHMEVSLVFGSGTINLAALGVTFLISCATLLLGLWVFRRLEPAFAEVM